MFDAPVYIMAVCLFANKPPTLIPAKKEPDSSCALFDVAKLSMKTNKKRGPPEGQTRKKN